MKQITNGKKPFLAVPVPKKSYDYYFTGYSLILMVHFDDDGVNNGHGYESEREIDLFSEPKCGTIIGKLSELTEERAAELVDESGEYRGMYKHYIHSGVFICTAKHSLQNLLQSNDFWLKEWIEKPKQNKKLSQASEDFLIILID